MSVTKVSDLHESATALDMVGDRTQSIQRKNVPVAKFQLQMAGETIYRLGMPSAIFYCQERFPMRYQNRCSLHPGGYFHIWRSGGLAPKFASEILVGAPNCASKNISDKYPKFCPLNFRYDCKIVTFSQLLRLVVTELPKFFLLFGELGWTLPQILPPNLM